MTMTVMFPVQERQMQLHQWNLDNTFLLMFKGNIWHNSAPFQDLRLQNLSNLDFVLTRAPTVKYDGAVGLSICYFLLVSDSNTPRPGSVVVERSPGMRDVGCSIPGRVKQKTLKFEVLLLCLALSTKELETV